MSLLLFTGNLLLWALLTVLSGFMGGVGLAGGFAAFKSLKNKFTHKVDELQEEKNHNYLDSLEQQVAGSTVTP